MTIQPSLLWPLVFSSTTLATTPAPIEIRSAVPTNSATKIFILFLYPVFRTFYSLVPKIKVFFHLFRVHSGAKGLIRFRKTFQFLAVFPIAHSQSCQISSSQGSGFCDLWPFYLTLDEVSLELHQEIVFYCTSIYFHLFGGFAAVFLHGLQYISDLIGNGFESSPSKMGASRSSGNAEKCTSCILVPMGST